MRCLEDERLVDYLREHQIPLEVCPTSNECLKVVNSFAEHPLPLLLAKGLSVTLSDDPALFRASLTDEYPNSHINSQLGLSLPSLKQLSYNALNASLLSEAEKQKSKSYGRSGPLARRLRKPATRDEPYSTTELTFSAPPKSRRPTPA